MRHSGRLRQIDHAEHDEHADHEGIDGDQLRDEQDVAAAPEQRRPITDVDGVARRRQACRRDDVALDGPASSSARSRLMTAAVRQVSVVNTSARVSDWASDGNEYGPVGPDGNNTAWRAAMSATRRSALGR